jgi:zinc protease
VAILLALAVSSLAVRVAAADVGSGRPGGADAALGGLDLQHSPDLPRLAIRRTRLDNGLRVVLSRDTSLPTVAICVTYGVGARNEAAGQQGFAQLLERLMFQGSRNVAAGEHVRWIREHGGQATANSSGDRTQFVDRLPATALALGLWLEADRMQALELSDDDFERQLRRVRRESDRKGAQARAIGDQELRALVFRDYPATARGPLGSSSELSERRVSRPGTSLDSAQPTAHLQALRDFHRQLYAPNNAVLSVVGNFEVLETLNLIHTYFADAASVSLPAAPGGAPPEQTEPRSVGLAGPATEAASLWQGWAIPAPRTAEHDALDLAKVILGAGPSSRLQQLLVTEKGLAQTVLVWTDEQRGPDLFGVQATLTESADPELVSRAIQGQIASLARLGPSARELTRAQNQLRSSLLLGLDGNRARAGALADAELFGHDARLLETDLERYRQVSRDDVQRAVARYLRSARRSEVRLRPQAP